MVMRIRHAVYKLYYHLVFIPKNWEPRRKGAYASRLRSIFEELCDDKDLELVEAEINLDLAHLDIGSPPPERSVTRRQSGEGHLRSVVQ